jgi:hypothetical protein
MAWFSLDRRLVPFAPWAQRGAIYWRRHGFTAIHSASKEIMEKARVPVVPGFHGENQDPVHLKQQAEAIGCVYINFGI